MRVLLTGANGFIGSFITAALIAEGHARVGSSPTLSCPLYAGIRYFVFILMAGELHQHFPDTRTGAGMTFFILYNPLTLILSHGGERTFFNCHARFMRASGLFYLRFEDCINISRIPARGRV